jgi:hypothetical protein
LAETSGFSEGVLLTSEVEVEVDVAIGFDTWGRRGVSKAGFMLIGGPEVAVGEGMRVMPGEGVVCWAEAGQVGEGRANASEDTGGDGVASETIASKTSCTDGKSEGFGSLSPKAQKIFVYGDTSRGCCTTLISR